VSNEHDPFERSHVVSQPGIIGASWWRESLANPQDSVTRRSAIKLALGATGAVVGLGAILAIAHGCSADEEHNVQRRSSLEMQRTYGWSFGASTESVTFDGASTQPFERSALRRLATDLRPSSVQGRPYYVGALFEALGAAPTLAAAGDPENITPLEQVLTPMHTYDMDRAFAQGRALAQLLQSAHPVLVIVDLEGPSAVAFAAGASVGLVPVFMFGNWPHPRGVVKAHRTLAAAAYYQPLFAALAPKERPLLLVLDRQRLASYSDDATQFDNRYVPRLPDSATLLGWGIARVLYVTPSASGEPEPWDLTDDFGAYGAARIDVKLVSADAFSTQKKTDSGTDPAAVDYYYGGRPETHHWFWRDYPWLRGKPRDAVEPAMRRPGVSYRAPTAGQDLTPANLGTVPVAVSVATGAVLGALLSRSGSWNRSEGGGSGG
jgi:hypothetical protein